MSLPAFLGTGRGVCQVGYKRPYLAVFNFPLSDVTNRDGGDCSSELNGVPTEH